MEQEYSCAAGLGGRLEKKNVVPSCYYKQCSQYKRKVLCYDGRHNQCEEFKIRTAKDISDLIAQGKNHVCWEE